MSGKDASTKPAEKSIVQEARDIQLAMELITLGARLQMLESETQLSRGRLIKLYKELRGSPPPKGMLPFSTDWFMTWEQNIHSSMFYNAYSFLLKSGHCNGVEAVIKAYRLYLEQCPEQPGEAPILALTRAWTLVRFVDSGMLQLSACNCCEGSFITHAHQPRHGFVCSLCQPPSRAVKKRKLSPQVADITSQELDEQVKRAV
ncbi:MULTISPECIES: flagellar transcriptional regulator FlhC [Rahnella]|jgi:flagellar transcriptional activator FlhC|uniref:Flagellar transcriptional regulator FlhC n=3 Tax=Rahnella TaxID=34037 RepID=A0A6M2AZQ9_9GAMM|nr:MULTISPECIES: flagellar transcriptional regulator FlhC [Rahnella]KAB8308806.1 flagellar transcriptional regulator FlhC [Rouxiella chamberiensis]UJD88937.1 flagellar transcriptional regulator FlhC [Rahnella aquatilis]MBF7980238.1 flagellar transcriptional regulator FlhC [Rahnella laticis]MBF7993307.1 flagellar transcriptional regulator FlhC [Rahnella laticis]MBF8000503.1 flagellar transcriptional regulator FlhC [Rahnella sp. LAC-M12]